MDTDLIPVTNEDLLHQVFDQSSAGFQVIDKDWRYIFVNDAVAKQGKSSPSELIGKTMMEKYPGIDSTPLFTELKKTMEDKVAIRMENKFVFPDGTEGWFQLFIHPWSDGIMIFSVDITSRKEAEKELLKKVAELENTETSSESKQKISDLKEALMKLQKPEVTVV